MKRTSIATLVLVGCIMDKQLSDTETIAVDDPESSSSGDSTGHTSLQDTDGLSMTATMASEGEASGTTTMEGETTESSTGPGPLQCIDWVSRGEECEPHGDAVADVTAELPLLLRTQCQISAIDNVDASSDIIRVACDDVYAIRITSSSPHLDLPLAVGQDVLFEAYDDRGERIPDPPSFSILSMTGEPLVLWIHELDDFTFSSDVQLDGFNYYETDSSCPTYTGECFNEEILLRAQRRPIGFGEWDEHGVHVFDGHHALVDTGAGEMNVIVDHAHAIACHDQGCDTGATPSQSSVQELRMLLVAPTSG